jgi:opine dehydrogenase
MSGTEMKKPWTIIGAGMGGKGLAAQLGIDGLRLRIHDVDESQIAGIRDAGGLHVEGRDKVFAPIEMATTDLAAAVKGADVILVSTYGTVHEEVAASLAPLLEDGQAVVLIQGHFLGAVGFRAALDRANCRAQVDVAEMDAYPYMLTVKSPDRVLLTSVKPVWGLAAYPLSRSQAVLDRIGFAFPGLRPAPDMLETAFADMGQIFHVGGIITNVGNVEHEGDYNFYAKNMVPSVCNLLIAIDVERMAVANAFNVKTLDIATFLGVVYGFENMTVHEGLQKMAVTHYRYAPAPKSLEHRYLVQDVMCGLVPIAAFGRIAGVKTPVLDSVIQIANSLAGRDFYADGRNATNLGLEGKSVEEIRQMLAG